MRSIRNHFFAALLALAAFASHAAGYRVIDTMPDYWAFHDEAEALDETAQLELFRHKMVAKYPQLYNGEVLSGDKTIPFDAQLPRRFVRVRRLVGDKVPLMRKLSDTIAADLPRYEARFREVFPDLDYQGDVYFMHSLGGFDGGTRKIAGKTALLFGIDMIAYVYGTDIDPQPFFHHELFHIYHQQFRGNGTRMETIAGALWREGLATYVAQTLNPQANGVSIFGIPLSTPERTQMRLPEITRSLKALLDSKDKEDYARFFTGARENAAMPARSGYYVGYLVAAKIAKKYPLGALPKLPYKVVRAEMEKALDELALGL